MVRFILLFLVCFTANFSIYSKEKLDDYFFLIKQLEFKQASLYADQFDDVCLRLKTKTLAGILYSAGQDKSWDQFTVNGLCPSIDKQTNEVIDYLIEGYKEFYSSPSRGNSYKIFFRAYTLAKQSNDKELYKASLYAILNYYRYEIVQNSNAYQPYLDELSRLNLDEYDNIRIKVYMPIFYSKKLDAFDINTYLNYGEDLSEISEQLPRRSALWSMVNFENGLMNEIKDDKEKAKSYYNMVIKNTRQDPFLKDILYSAHLKLAKLSITEQHYDTALSYIDKAQLYKDNSDSLYSNMYIKYYQSMANSGLNNFEDAYNQMDSTFQMSLLLNFQENSIELNRLNIELQTQEKEKENERLKANRNWWLGVLVTTVLSLLILAVFYRNAIIQRKLVEKEKNLNEEKLNKALKEQELNSLDAMIIGQEKERSRIANDLHDNLGGLLATLKLHFQNFKVKKDRLREEEDALYNTTDELIDDAYQKVRTMAHAKNAGLPAKEGLLPAVKNFAAKVSIANRLVIEVVDHGMETRLENTIEITIFRILQELITNIIKHSVAKHAVIYLTQHEDKINVMVEDDGVGFDISLVDFNKGMGLSSIQTRVNSLNGTFKIDSNKGKGATIIIDIPIA